MNVALHTIELFAGVGMLGVGLRAGLAHLGLTTRTVCYVEREAFAASVLAARMAEGALDDAPVWSDVCTFDARAWRGSVDCVIGGFPCQDLSLAGRRAGLDGKRSGLFFELLRIAEDSGARYLFLENVGGIASATASVVDEEEGELEERAAARVLGELADRGWNAEWLTLSASEVGASHGRERWFCWAWRNVGNTGLQHQHVQQREDGTEHPRAGGLMACEFCGYEFPEELGRYGCPNCEGDELAHPARHGRHQGRAESGGIEGRPDAAECFGAVADASSTRSTPLVSGQDSREKRNTGFFIDCGHVALFAPGPADAGWTGILAAAPWLAPALTIEEELNAAAAFTETESVLHRMADGLARGLDFHHRAARLKCCGNGAVPLQAAAAAVVLVRRMMEAA